MDLFAQKKSLIRIIIILTVLNMVSIGVFLWKDVVCKSPQHQRVRDDKNVSAILQKELQLTQQQFELLRNLRTKYCEKEKVIELLIRSERDSMNIAMFNKTTNEELVKTLARKVADNEFNMELLRFEQSKEFKTICNAYQLGKFGAIVKEIRDYFKPDKQANDKKNNE